MHYFAMLDISFLVIILVILQSFFFIPELSIVGILFGLVMLFCVRFLTGASPSAYALMAVLLSLPAFLLRLCAFCLGKVRRSEYSLLSGCVE